jgi:hypothetical protein
MFTNIQSIFSASSYKKCTALIVSVIILILCFQGISAFASSPQGNLAEDKIVLSIAQFTIDVVVEGEVWAEDGGETTRMTNGSLVDNKSWTIIESWKSSSEKPYFAGNTPWPSESWKSSDFWLNVLNGGIDVLFSLLTPFLILAGWLLSPDWVFGEVFWLRPVLYDLWKLMSNIVYVAFAFLLIVMAFMNIYGGEKNAWAIKTKLPKLIIWVISVPFTWFFVSAIISISTILTASTIQLAGDLSKNTPSEFSFNVPTKCTLDFNGSITGTWSATKFYNCDKTDWKTDKKPQKLSELLMSDNPYGILSHYAYSVFKVDTLKNLTWANVPTIKAVWDITMGLFVAILVFLIFMLITAMLILALFMRAIHFWMIAIFSPLLSLKYFLEDKMTFGEKWLSVPKIISLAMVPVYVSAALAFWLVFISAIWWAKMPTSEGAVVKIDKNTMTAFGTEYEVKWTPLWSGNNVNGSADTSLSGNVFWQLIIYFLALAVLWIAVTAAINSSEITKEAAQPVAEFGNQIGGIIKKLPQYAPIIPTGHGHASLNNLSGISSWIQSAMQQRWNSEAHAMGVGIAERMWFKMDDKLKGMRSELARYGAQIDKNQLDDAFTDILRQSKVKSIPEFIAQSAAQKEVYVDMINKSALGKDEKEAAIKQIKSTSALEIAKLFSLLEGHTKGELGWTRTLTNDTEINAFLSGLQNSSASPETNAATTAPVPLNVQIGEKKLQLNITRSGAQNKTVTIDQTGKQALKTVVSGTEDQKTKILTDALNKVNPEISNWVKKFNKEEIESIVSQILNP